MVLSNFQISIGVKGAPTTSQLQDGDTCAQHALHVSSVCVQGLQRCALLARRTDGLRHLVSCVSVRKTGAPARKRANHNKKESPKLPGKYAVKAPSNSFCASSRIVKTERGRFSKCSQTLRAPAQMCSVWSLTSHRPLIRHSVRTTTVSPQLWLRHTSNMKETTPPRTGRVRS